MSWLAGIGAVFKGFFASLWEAMRRKRQDQELVDNARRQAENEGLTYAVEASKKASPNGLGMYPVELVPSDEIDDDTAAAVSEVSLTETGIKIKLHDKRGALVDLGKHLGLFVDKVDHTSAGQPIRFTFALDNANVDRTGS